jgi:hypothetical protein
MKNIHVFLLIEEGRQTNAGYGRYERREKILYRHPTEDRGLFSQGIKFPGLGDEKPARTDIQS